MTSCPGNDETNLRYWAGSRTPLKRLKGCSIGSSNASKMDTKIVNLFFVKTCGEHGSKSYKSKLFTRPDNEFRILLLDLFNSLGSGMSFV